MNILLINPLQNTKYPQPPLGLLSIAPILNKIGHDVKILDANVDIVDINEITKPDIIGMTAMTPTIYNAIQLLQKLNKNDKTKDAVKILGGPHATILPKETLEKTDFDIAVIGEGEKTIIELVNAFGGHCKLKNVKGIAFKECGKVVINKSQEPIEDLDSLPILDYNLIDFKKYRPYPPHGRKLPFMPLITSRGCPYHCIYCTKVFTKYRYMSVPRILDEVKILKEKGIREIMFYDDSFTLNKKHILDLCSRLIEEKIKLPWSCETRVNLVDEELLNAMKDAGCYLISYGVESGDENILKILKKDITLEQIKNAFTLTKKHNIKTVAYLMFGSPQETQETIRKTINFPKELGADFAQFSLCTPFPGTELYEIASKSGFKFDWANSSYVNLNSQLNPNLNKDLKQAVKKAYKEFYLRKEFILAAISSFRDLNDAKVYLNGFKMLLNLIK